jgi:cyanophycin synthetase
MDLVEVRDLDGPNLFATYPVIKLDLILPESQLIPDSAARPLRELLNVHTVSPRKALEQVVGALHRMLELDEPTVGWFALDPKDRHVLFFPWEWRETSLLIAQLAYDAVATQLPNDALAKLQTALARDRSENDRPLWIRDAERRIPTVGITGTNGKTTTTRTLAHIVRTAGLHAGWSSTSGVYIDGEQVLEGDYTGPSGARRVLEDPDVDVAVLETARGGILLRGLAYESNDVGVFLNVSDDHLDMQGIGTVQTLAKVKSIVVRVTRPDGMVVLNADDPLVLAVREQLRAPLLLTSQRPTQGDVADHIARGGEAVIRDGNQVVHVHRGERTTLFSLDHAPMTFGGRAGHMVENLLAAVGAAIGLRLPTGAIVEGVRTFRSDTELNAGRLNTFDVNGTLVVIDYAHNESGLRALLSLGRAMVQSGSVLRAVIGTAGDRRDDVFRALGSIAARTADCVYIKETSRYLRGRAAGEASALMREGAEASGNARCVVGMYPDEVSALVAALDDASAGDVVVVMCVEQQTEMYQELQGRGAREWTGVTVDLE